MELKLTRTASEILNDIILHTLQEQGIEKAEMLEQHFFSQLKEPSFRANEQTNKDLRSFVVDGSYVVIYQQQEELQLVTSILHASRLPESFKS